MDTPSALEGRYTPLFAVASFLIALLVASYAIVPASVAPPAAKPMPYERSP